MINMDPQELEAGAQENDGQRTDQDREELIG